MAQTTTVVRSEGLTAVAIGVAAVGTVLLGVLPSAAAHRAQRRGGLRPVTALLPLTDEGSPLGSPSGWPSSSSGCSTRPSHADHLADATSRHLVSAGGKRLRPLLALLTAELGDADDPRVLDAAVVVELTHLATLYHDDVMDSAPVRRGAPAAHEVWGNQVAILTGDLLLAKASALTAGLGPAGRADPGPDLRAAVPRPAARDGRPGRRRRPGGPLPAGAGRQDRVAHRDLGPLRRDVRRLHPRNRRRRHDLRGEDRPGVPARRRRHRPHRRRQPDGQASRHRPARARAHHARAAAAPSGRPRTPATEEDRQVLALLDADLSDDADLAAAVRRAARAPGHRTDPRGRRGTAPPRPSRSSAGCRTGRCATRWCCSPTRSSSGRPEASPDRGDRDKSDRNPRPSGLMPGRGCEPMTRRERSPVRAIVRPDGRPWHGTEVSGCSTTWGSATDCGPFRRLNEDALLAYPPLFVVADGMGGHEAGEVASRIAVEEAGRPGRAARGQRRRRARRWSASISARLREAVTDGRTVGTTFAGVAVAHARGRRVLAGLQHRRLPGVPVRRRRAQPDQRRPLGGPGAGGPWRDRAGRGSAAPGPAHHHARSGHRVPTRSPTTG